MTNFDAHPHEPLSNERINEMLATGWLDDPHIANATTQLELDALAVEEDYIAAEQASLETERSVEIIEATLARVRINSTSKPPIDE